MMRESNEQREKPELGLQGGGGGAGKPPSAVAAAGDFSDEDEYIPLSKAAQSVPGRTSSNCVWRWCRTGVLARNGERVRLEHVRVGGKIFTRRSWLGAFVKRLAEHDTAYFDAKASAAAAAAPRDLRYASPRHQWRNSQPGAVSEETKRRFEESQRRHEAAERELDEEGL